MTPVEQYKTVSDGLAIACITAGRTTLRSDKASVERAFRRAWSQWPHAAQFPNVRASLQRNDGWPQVISRSSRRRPPGLAEWLIGRALQPILVDGQLVLQNAVEVLEEDSGLSLAHWKALAEPFADDLAR